MEEKEKLNLGMIKLKEEIAKQINLLIEEKNQKLNEKNIQIRTNGIKCLIKKRKNLIKKLNWLEILDNEYQYNWGNDKDDVMYKLFKNPYVK